MKRGGMAALVIVLSIGAATGARAQHVVTEAEAAKLTLEALTAPPPPPRPMYRAYVHRAMARSYVVRERGFGRHAAWRGGFRVSDRRPVHRALHGMIAHRHRH